MVVSNTDNEVVWNVTVLGDPLLMRRATPSARAHESVDVELLFMEQRRRMMKEWADYLDKLRIGADVIQFKAA